MASLTRVLAAAAVVAAAALGGAEAQVGTKVVTVPAGSGGAAAHVTVHVVEEKGRHPNSAPRPPTGATALAGAGLATFPATAATACGGASPCQQQMPVTTPAANLGQATDALTGGYGTATGSFPYPAVGVQSVPGAKIVGVDDQACGCKTEPQGTPCANPCKPVRTPADEIESRLTDVKNDIVNRAQKLQADSVWVKQVKELIQHYTAKIAAVNGANTALKSDIKRLFAKKKKYEDLLMQYSIDRDHFNRQVEQQAVEQKKE